MHHTLHSILFSRKIKQSMSTHYYQKEESLSSKTREGMQFPPGGCRNEMQAAVIIQGIGPFKVNE